MAKKRWAELVDLCFPRLVMLYMRRYPPTALRCTSETHPAREIRGHTPGLYENL